MADHGDTYERLMRMKVQLEALARVGTVMLTENEYGEFVLELPERGYKGGSLELAEAIDAGFRTLR